MDVEEFPPPPPEVMQNNLSFAYEDEGELFEFDEIPEADRQPPAPPLPDYEIETKAKDIDSTDDNHKDTQGHPLSNTQKTTLTNNDIFIKTEDSSFTTGSEVSEHDSPSDNLVSPAAEAARGSPLGKVNPYSVVDIAPLQEQSPIHKEDEVGQEDAASARVPSGYSVPVPCGYAIPSNIPLILPAYSTPVIIRHLSVDEEDPDEVIYDDVPRENSDSTTYPDEMIYDDVELGEEGGNSSPENGWSASEFESYDEQSDTESKSDNGIPNTFLRGKSQKHKMHMQKLMKAAKDGTKDGLEKTKAAVKRGRSFIKTKSLIQEEENQQGWFFTEDDGNRIKKQKHPLLVGQIPVVISKLQEFKVACAVHNPEPYCGYDNVPDSLSMGHGCLWVASCTNQMGQISIVTLHNSNPKVTECFNVESRIVCMVHIINEDKQEVPETCPDPEPAAGKATDSPTICLGMEEGSISVYKSSQRSKKVRLQHFFTPDKSTVMNLTYKSECLYAGLVSGAIAIYTKREDGSWNSDSPKILQLGVLPVKSVLAMEDTIWASSGGQLSIIGTKTHIVERQLEAHQEEGVAVSHMAVAGVGVWIAFSSSSTLRLFHTETLEHLQDINIATPIHNMLPGQLRVSVTSLLVCHGLLMAGTNLGIIVALPVPRLQGIPKVTGRGMVSYHAHTGPVKFLTMAAAVSSKKQRCTSVSSAPSQPEGKDGEQRNCSPEGLSSLLNTKDKGVWLGDSTKSIAQQSTLSASSGSLALSHVSLEHGPEDGTIYELLNDPSFSLSDKRSKKMTVSSVLVVSGGLGHRRVNKKSKQQRQDETVSTIMVWQIPLLNI
ncbi:Rho guanine nucleotide exchange factor 10 [Acipenser ruthenus]|uniref:Rho guanine nucleotide exchange factor 10 n=1 Tax=Acipenser ruthenus TaxID=7906 RepID=A0A444TW60_ACIRT|nr:Rho guanine nucleotide exchange factor 10 [Acipenser ruthenus]